MNTLLFSSENWNKAQTVYVVALDDNDVVDGPITMTLNIANASSYVYVDGLSLATETFSLWIEDNDEAGITITLISASSVIYEEGRQVSNGSIVSNVASHSITVELTAQPVKEVIVDLSAVNIEVNASYRFVYKDMSVKTLSFSSTNWNSIQTLYFEALTDLDVADALVSITLKVAEVVIK